MDFFCEEESSKQIEMTATSESSMEIERRFDLKYSGTYMTLKNADDLSTLKELTQDRKEWTNLVEKNYVVAEAA